MKQLLSIICHLTAFCLTQNLLAEGSSDLMPPASIPFNQVGAVADKQYSGSGVGRSVQVLKARNCGVISSG